jgi:hypothetical protein
LIKTRAANFSRRQYRLYVSELLQFAFQPPE